MPGPNKWSKIKRRKGALDVKRGKIFSRLSKEITAATRLGGDSPASNPRLRAAIAMARTESMPNEYIARAIKKGGRAEELTRDGKQFGITPPPDQLYLVTEVLKTAGIEPESPKLTFLAENAVAVTDEKTATRVIKLRHVLDDLNDVMNVHANFDIPELTLAKPSAH